MKRLVETIKNIWSIDELRSRILFTLALIAVYRVGVQIVLPGINPGAIPQNNNAGGLLGLINSFAGGAFDNGSIFALGIMPYISASIAMQLLTIAVPSFKKLNSDESGRRKINMYTRYLTILITFVQGLAYINHIRQTMGSAIIADTFTWRILVAIVLTAGTLFVMWVGEKITEKGIGNGTSIIIMAGIIARLIPSLVQEWSQRSGGGGGLLFFVIEIIALVAIIAGIIIITQGTRRIPLNFARRVTGATSVEEIEGSRNFIPLKVNMANVMPIIFAQAILFIPGFIFSGSTNKFASMMQDPSSWLYNLIYVVLVIGFTFFYTALIMNPTQMSDDLKRQNAFIPGVKPGEETANYIGTIIDRITLPGAIILALIGILPALARLPIFGISSGFANFFGGTSMLIMVGVILDTLQQVETKLLERKYDGLMDSGRITGRTPLDSPTPVAS